MKLIRLSPIVLVLSAVCWLPPIQADKHDDSRQSLIKIEVENHGGDDAISQNDQKSQQSADPKPPNPQLFKATDEWKRIEPNDILPKGLHVRVNLETGAKEAKLLGEDRLAVDDFDINSRRTTSYQIVSNLNDPNGPNSPKAREISADHDRFLRDLNKLTKNQKFSNNMTTKSMNMTSKSMVNYENNEKLLKTLLNRYEMTQNSDEKLSILLELEDLLHEIDCGEIFTKLNGFSLLLADLKSIKDFDQLRIEILAVFASTIQSNQYVKQQLAKQQFLAEILDVFNENLNSDSSNLNIDLLRKFFLVLSTYLRNNSRSELQQFYHRFSGKQLLNQLFHIDQRLAVKIAAFVSDLIDESNSSTIDIIDPNICDDIYQLMISGEITEKMDFILLLESIMNLRVKCQYNPQLFTQDILEDSVNKSQFKDNEYIQELIAQLSSSGSHDEL